jgi:hypothetical protein
MQYDRVISWKTFDQESMPTVVVPFVLQSLEQYAAMGAQCIFAFPYLPNAYFSDYRLPQRI